MQTASFPQLQRLAFVATSVLVSVALSLPKLGEGVA